MLVRTAQAIDKLVPLSIFSLSLSHTHTTKPNSVSNSLPSLCVCCGVIGGNLQVGGVGDRTFKLGAASDYVQDLLVVTGELQGINKCTACHTQPEIY